MSVRLFPPAVFAKLALDSLAALLPSDAKLAPLPADELRGLARIEIVRDDRAMTLEFAQNRRIGGEVLVCSVRIEGAPTLWPEEIRANSATADTEIVSGCVVRAAVERALALPAIRERLGLA